MYAAVAYCHAWMEKSHKAPRAFHVFIVVSPGDWVTPPPIYTRIVRLCVPCMWERAGPPVGVPVVAAAVLAGAATVVNATRAFLSGSSRFLKKNNNKNRSCRFHTFSVFPLGSSTPLDGDGKRARYQTFSIFQLKTRRDAPPHTHAARVMCA